MSRKLSIIVIGLFFCGSIKTFGQVLVPTFYMKDYYDVLRMKNNIKEPITLFPSLIHMYQVDSTLQWDIWDGRFSIQKRDGDFVEVLDPHLRLNYTSGLADGYNDGAVWEGKGLNTSANFGFTGKKGKFHFTFAPVVFYAQNKDFLIANGPFGKNQFQYPFENKIDWVLRYGDQSAAQFHPGQSEIRFIHKNITVGVSTQNMFWGPAQISPILMSNNAGGIPHLDFGSPGPIPTKIGNIEYRIFWGMMNESVYFDNNSSNDERYITGATFGFQPKFIPGLNIGLNRVLYRDMFDGDFKPVDLFAAVWKSIDDPDLPNDNYDQMMSLMVKWKFKEQGFDAYIEWARNDFPGTIVDFFENPERTRAVTMGLVKTFDLKEDAVLRIVYEHTKLNKIKMSVATNGHPTYYVHSVVDNGYTNNGQLMGSYIGPGSNAHHIRAQYYDSKGRIGFFFDRVRHNDDYIIATNPPGDELPAESTYRIGIDYLRFIDRFSFDLRLASGYRKNWYYNDEAKQFNHSMSINVGYQLNK